MLVFKRQRAESLANLPGLVQTIIVRWEELITCSQLGTHPLKNVWIMFTIVLADVP